MDDQATTSEKDRWWTVQRGAGPIVATAIHDGSGLRDEIRDMMKLAAPDRLREEDPFTGQAIVDVPTHIIVHRSRFEFDLNRGADGAVYETPEQCWGLDVWHAPLGDGDGRPLARHPRRIITGCSARCSTTSPPTIRASSLLDVHSYNHRRDGPDGDADSAGRGAGHQHRHIFDAAR